MFQYEFMRYAFLASTFIAITCGVVGVYVVARSYAFLAHTLSEIGFAGAAFAVFIGIAPLWGMLLFTLLGSIGVGELSLHSDQKESSVSAISALFIGLGVLFLAISGSNSRYATNILFGSIIGVDKQGVIQLVVLSILVLLLIILVARSLNFDSFDHIGAVHTGWVGIAFLVALAMSVAIGAQIVGSLLVFILLTLPSSTARYIGKTIPAMISWSVFFALVGVWAGLYLGFITNWPVTFFIATIEVVIYLIAYGIHVIKHR